MHEPHPLQRKSCLNVSGIPSVPTVAPKYAPPIFLFFYIVWLLHIDMMCWCTSWRRMKDINRPAFMNIHVMMTSQVRRFEVTGSGILRKIPPLPSIIRFYRTFERARLWLWTKSLPFHPRNITCLGRSNPLQVIACPYLRKESRSAVLLARGNATRASVLSCILWQSVHAYKRQEHLLTHMIAKHTEEDPSNLDCTFVESAVVELAAILTPSDPVELGKRILNIWRLNSHCK